MKLHKIFRGLMLCAAVGATTACTDLDETLYDSLNETNVDLTNENDLSLLLGAANAQYRYLVADWFGMFHLLEESGDQYMVPARVGVGWGDAYINLHRHNWGTEVGQILNPWQLAYRGVGYANQVIDALGEPTDANRASLAHARFFRAMFYYHLLDMFGNPPLQTTQQVEAGYLPQQVGTQALWQWCVEEFTWIKENIGDDNYFGFGNRYAATMALAKLQLNKNAWLGTTDNAGYEAALAAVNEIIASGKYSLAPAYKDNFRESIKDCPEVIFAVPCDRTHTAQFGLQSYCFPQTGLLAYGSNAAGYNGSCGIPQWIRTYDSSDARLTDTWAGGLQTYGEGCSEINSGYVTGEPIPFDTHDWAGQGYLNYNINVHSIDNPGAFQQEGYRLHKYEIVADSKNRNKGTTATDIVIFRYADVLMIKAECLLRLSTANDDEAAQLVSEVRKRSFSSANKATRTAADLRGASVYAYGHEEYTTSDENGYNDWSNKVSTTEGGADIELGGLLDDLGWEFCGEMHRRQDLRRFRLTGTNANVWNGKSWFCKDATPTVTTYDWYCIPSDAMKANVKLVQNPGY